MEALGVKTEAPALPATGNHLGGAPALANDRRGSRSSLPASTSNLSLASSSDGRQTPPPQAQRREAAPSQGAAGRDGRPAAVEQRCPLPESTTGVDNVALLRG